ncbi:gamma-glutamylcyclotransferase (GGCT)/AIG2-like uncharacterized protein YtfP [Scopulibacillus darangshiensis]|uniref:Gamma-glutamylcyclotransferase family protein n=1 Tax=Scopulibacillus darangshiensis TaxID=442528 RepID=A0A4V2SMZ5_9BACL|nr:gamma-glutamylcyclotransferase family protein [Scopulibacillus darangshiensis]TCP29226.1 gamma-glutamylcyclotransferase (GGCT)/AIG2-like uncharacterized protein YtfP [Scopulibacillus darangshiensis]
MAHNVFVYGTLRKGERNHHLLADSPCIAEQAWTNGQLFATDSYYPAMILGEDLVYGEVYTVTDEILAQLDELENHKGDPETDLYDRKATAIHTDSETLQAFVYLLVDKQHEVLGGPILYNDWKVHRLFNEKEDYLYFAYGSCMDDDRFKKAKIVHCFQNLIGRGVLDGYTLKFAMKGAKGGAADIVEHGGAVEGKVYHINKEGLAYLLIREGVEAGHYRPAIISCHINGELSDNVLTFIVCDKAEELKPTDIYANEILRGGTGTLSEAYLAQLKEKLKNQFNMLFD